MHSDNLRGIAYLVFAMALFAATDACVQLASQTLTKGQVLTLMGRRQRTDLRCPDPGARPPVDCCRFRQPSHAAAQRGGNSGHFQLCYRPVDSGAFRWLRQ